MTDLPSARRLLRHGAWEGAAAARVLLDYDARFLRRKRLETEDGRGFLVDLPETVSLGEGDAFELEDGSLVEIGAAPEEVLVVTGALTRAAWHIGNRHTPCQIEADRLLIKRDHVLEGMLRGLGLTVAEAVEPFTPEGGAYGHGRTMGHDHGPEAGHSHGEGHSHPHVHVHVSRKVEEDDITPDVDPG
ncbi:urease accessory protein UreE [Cereibacter changlensis]|uniref:Urease accessory protein UreE n=1 Tax=Cereibacter changlensis TaxID=402884 RepID=A0A4V5NLQ3_9RHOB|nr:urease accessory protein UreE [Cereibacter changlensis]TKA96517.1 urease accessory protein UreE [Cereibacter changlensis]